MRFSPNSFGVVQEKNSCHTPAGTPAGGQFCSAVAGITSSRGADDPLHHRSVLEVQREGKRLLAALKKIKGVSNASVTAARGAWDGGGEPAWNVTYQGNGEARRLLLQTGRRWNQDSVLLASSGGQQELREYTFGNLDVAGRAKVAGMLAKAGAGGWTWFRHKRQTVLRLIEAPGMNTTPAGWAQIVRAMSRVEGVKKVRTKKVTATNYWHEGEGRRWGTGPSYSEGMEVGSHV